KVAINNILDVDRLILDSDANVELSDVPPRVACRTRSGNQVGLPAHRQASDFHFAGGVVGFGPAISLRLRCHISSEQELHSSLLFLHTRTPSRPERPHAWRPPWS